MVSLCMKGDKAQFPALTLRGPCIVIYSYNKTNETHYFSNLYLE